RGTTGPSLSRIFVVFVVPIAVYSPTPFLHPSQNEAEITSTLYVKAPRVTTDLSDCFFHFPYTPPLHSSTTPITL
ncbi:MAG: hypothetical protein LAT55_10710, partial [Opitutales bacterium]|nr:hypothetical protein [Opitutales bacterium]